MKFPKKIFITIENEDEEDEFFMVNKGIEGIPELWPKGKVGVYELKEIQEVTWEYTTKSIR